LGLVDTIVDVIMRYFCIYHLKISEKYGIVGKF